MSVYLFDRGLRAVGVRPGQTPWSGAVRLLSAAALAATFYPLVKAYSLGQIQVWIDALFAVLVATWGRRPAVSGACLGVMCLIKPQFALIGAWALPGGSGASQRSAPPWCWRVWQSRSRSTACGATSTTCAC